ncbi:ABC transporter permease subunit [Streptosporangium canum]|uniref:ABC transporter permease subunit n=1 Tax=Streptosporangium canum TaxID=324952 RepID=UPI003426AECC
MLLTEERAAAKAAARPGRRPRCDWLWGYGLIAPMALGLAVFYLWPIVQTLYLSFTESGVFGGQTWVGVDNFAALFGDEEMLGALRNTLLYSVLVLIGVPLAIVIAALLNVPGLRGLGFYRTLYFLPVVTMPAAVGLTWRYLYNGDFGLINYLLGEIGIDGPYWVSDPEFAIYAIAVVGIWSSLGYNAVLFLAGLQGIPKHYYEAAAIDGAGRMRQFFKTLPRELDEAARLDGANPLQIYWWIMLPLVRPGLLALGLLTVMWSWSSLLWPLVVNTDPEMMTLSAGLASLRGQYLTNYPILFAGSVVASLPVIVLFVVMQRQLIAGIAFTGSKG